MIPIGPEITDETTLLSLAPGQALNRHQLVNQTTGASAADLPLPRLHWFELHDQEWCPALLRDSLTEWLRAVWEYSKAATVLAPVLAEAIRKSGAESIVDLCSGGSGPIVPIQFELESLGVFLPAVATDKFPNPESMARIQRESGNRVLGRLEPLDAMALDPDLTGFRTLFNSFHHFTPPQARRILADAHRSRQPIGIFEVTARTMARVLRSGPESFLSVFYMMTRMHPPKLTWWLLTYLVPVIPTLIAWDGLVSHLRSYSDAELADLTRGLNDKYVWEIGQVRSPRARLQISYLIGRPI